MQKSLVPDYILKGGVSDGEMEDLLSMDDAVLGEVFQYSILVF